MLPQAGEVKAETLSRGPCSQAEQRAKIALALCLHGTEHIEESLAKSEQLGSKVSHLDDCGLLIERSSHRRALHVLVKLVL